MKITVCDKNDVSQQFDFDVSGRFRPRLDPSLCLTYNLNGSSVNKKIVRLKECQGSGFNVAVDEHDDEVIDDKDDEEIVKPQTEKPDIPNIIMPDQLPEFNPEAPEIPELNLPELQEITTKCGVTVYRVLQGEYSNCDLHKSYKYLFILCTKYNF